MKRKSLLLAAASFLILSQLPVSADVITAFSVTPDTGTPFTTVDLNAEFNGSLARITNSAVACDSDAACVGEVATFSLTIANITGTTPAQGTFGRHADWKRHRARRNHLLCGWDPVQNG